MCVCVCVWPPAVAEKERSLVVCDHSSESDETTEDGVDEQHDEERCAAAVADDSLPSWRAVPIVVVNVVVIVVVVGVVVVVFARRSVSASGTATKLPPMS